MNAMEKVAWTEVIVAGLAIICVIAAYPWLGDAAAAFFSILAFIAAAAFFVRKRDNEVVTDERDTTIEKKAITRAMFISWMTTVVLLIVLTISFGCRNMDIPSRFIVWLVSGQAALVYLAKGLITLCAYRGARHAAQG